MLEPLAQPAAAGAPVGQGDVAPACVWASHQAPGEPLCPELPDTAWAAWAVLAAALHQATTAATTAAGPVGVLTGVAAGVGAGAGP
ncbi:MAG TPA: hypothetical protein VFR49_13800, partial [Solirubrobacteraceae bacterium]|nr:hypothetical protein [Solirubrobacteraceae bacterium]